MRNGRMSWRLAVASVIPNNLPALFFKNSAGGQIIGNANGHGLVCVYGFGDERAEVRFVVHGRHGTHRNGVAEILRDLTI